MSRHLERRNIETRAVVPDDAPTQDGLPRRFWARVVNYGVLDDYGTRFREGFADEYLARRLPRLMYGHGGWENPNAIVGKGVDWRNVPGEGLDILFEFDDFEYVPTARQLAYQLRNGTLDEFSIGFLRQRDERDVDGSVWVTKARLGEVSIVAEGSVPGTRLLSFRQAGGTTVETQAVVDANEVARIISQLYLGEIDLAQALHEVKTLATTPDPNTTPNITPDQTPGVEPEQESPVESVARSDSAAPETGEGSAEEPTGNPPAPASAEPEPLSETLPETTIQTLIEELDAAISGAFDAL